MRNYERFGPVLVALVRPIYVLQMGRTKQWSEQAQDRHLRIMREACYDVIAYIDRQVAPVTSLPTSTDRQVAP